MLEEVVVSGRAGYGVWEAMWPTEVGRGAVLAVCGAIGGEVGCGVREGIGDGEFCRVTENGAVGRRGLPLFNGAQ